MVNEKNNYNSDRITMSPINLLKIKILDRRDVVLNYLEEYYYNKSRNIDSSLLTAKLSAAIKVLYSEIRQSYLSDVKDSKKRTKKENILPDITILIYSKSIVDNIEAFNNIDSWLYDIKKITMFDSNKSYDRSDPLMEDQVNNL